MNKSFVEKLKNNPIFQLSLSSKELFHSNFLAWLAEDENTRGIFNHLMKVWMNKEFDDKEMMVKREYNNFDFCICEKVCNYHSNMEDEELENKYIPGKIIFVLENKFKSLPYKEQLEKYHEKILSLNVQGLKDKEKSNNGNKRLSNKWVKEQEQPKTKYLLLTLADNILDKDDENDKSITTTNTCTCGEDKAEWKVVNYSEYSKLLRELNNDDALWKDAENKCFYRELINLYCDFIDTFSHHVQDCLSKISNNDGKTIKEDICWNELTSHTEFVDIRCNDIWQKLFMHKCAKHLKSLFGSDYIFVYNSNDKYIWEENNLGDNKLYLGVGFVHGEALIELKYPLSEEITFFLLQQGNHPLSAGVVVKGKTKEDIDENKDEKSSQIKKLLLKVMDEDDCQWNKLLSINGSYCSLFRYPIKKEEIGVEINGEKKLSVSKTIYKMKDLMIKAINSK